jgi:predicted Zn-dependent protease
LQADDPCGYACGDQGLIASVIAHDERILQLYQRPAKQREASTRLRAALRPAAALMLVGLTLSGCQVLQSATGDATLRPSGSPVTVDTLTRNDRLASIAREQHPRILATYGGEYSNPTVERMVARVVGNLTLDPDNPNQTYQITILNSPNINAFALPGGYLYVTRGLLALANDSAELAAVLAHEMAHVTANHGIQRQQREAEEQLASQVVSDVLGGTAPGRLALIRGQLRLAQFSRNQELEADAVGIRAIGRAGYDPHAAVRFLQSMAAYGELRSVNAAIPTSASISWPPIPTRPSVSSWRAAMPGSSARRERARATATVSSPASTACCMATRPTKVS